MKDTFDPEAAASAPSETLVLLLISDVEETIETVDEFTEAICLELDDKLMQEDLENNSKYVLTFSLSTNANPNYPLLSAKT